MKTLRVQLLVACLLAIHQVALAQKWWMDEPYGDDAYNARQEYGDNVTLTCSDDLIPQSYEIRYWIRPDLTVMDKGDSEQFWTLDGYASWRVSNDGMQMHVTLLQERQFGFYHCVVYSTPSYHVVKKGINYKGPYFGDLWAKYRMNTIIGLSAGGGFLALSIICILIYVFFLDEEQPEEGETSDSMEKEGREAGSSSSEMQEVTTVSGSERTPKSTDSEAYENLALGPDDHADYSVGTTHF